MQLCELELGNCCQHKHFKHNFKSGITGILGPNGSGKTNLVRMLAANLLGNYKTSGYAVKDNIQFGTSTAKIRGVWRHKEVQFEIIRTINQGSSATSLYTDNSGLQLNHVMEINDQIENLVGAGRKLINDYAFVDQWGIFNFLFAPRADRVKIFMQLCNMDYIKNIRDSLSFNIRDDSKFITSVIEDPDDIQKEIIEVTARLAAERDSYNFLLTQILPKKTERFHSVRLKVFKKLVDLKSELEDVTRSCEDVDANLARAEKIQTTLRARLNDVEQLFEESLDKLSTFKAVLSKLDLLENKKRALSDRKKRLDSIKNLPDEKPVCEVEEPRDVLYDRLSKSNNKISHLLEKIRLFVEEGVTSCPVCDTRIEDIPDLDDINEVLADEQKQRDNTADRLRKRKDFESRLSEWQRTIAVRKSLIVNMESEIKLLQDEISDLEKELDDIDRKKIDSFVVAHKKLQETRNSIVKDLNAQSGTVSELVGSKQILLLKQKELHKKIENLDNVSEEEYLESKDILEKNAEAKAKQEIHSKLIKELSKQLETLQRRHRSTDALITRNIVAERWVTKLRSLSELFKTLPEMVMVDFMEKVCEEATKYLEMFNSPFQIKADNNLSIFVKKKNTKWFKALRLSGGEKVVLALAIRLAISSLFARELGILVLDEPTAGMDTDNVDYLCDVLSSLGAVLRKEDEQVIMVTHDMRLERAFDDVITLTKK